MRKCKLKRKVLRSVLNREKKRNKSKTHKTLKVGLDKSSLVNNVLSLLNEIKDERKGNAKWIYPWWGSDKHYLSDFSFIKNT